MLNKGLRILGRFISKGAKLKLTTVPIGILTQAIASQARILIPIVGFNLKRPHPLGSINVGQLFLVDLHVLMDQPNRSVRHLVRLGFLL